jgi:RNA polymerase sigma-70 factor, ECF subfamily
MRFLWRCILRDVEIEVEVEAQRLRTEGKFDEAATLIVSSYGPGVLGFLVSLTGEYADAGDAFAQACEDLWRSLPRFRGEASIKTWFYMLARHTLWRLRRSATVSRHLPLSAISECAAHVRSQTEPYLKSEFKSGVAAIRSQLAEEDRLLLMLRIDRQMSWNEIAQILSGDTSLERQNLVRVAARLRKRFQIVKESIRDRAREMKLMDANTDVEH